MAGPKEGAEELPRRERRPRERTRNRGADLNQAQQTKEAEEPAAADAAAAGPTGLPKSIRDRNPGLQNQVAVVAAETPANRKSEQGWQKVAGSGLRQGQEVRPLRLRRR